MPPAPIDPSPRSYPRFVTLMRRSSDGRDAAPAETTAAAIEAWLLADAIAIEDLLPLYESLVWRMVAAGLPLARASVHVGTLHPQLLGFAWNWNAGDGLTDEVKVDAFALQTDQYKRNPLYRVIEHGEHFRLDTADPDVAGRYPITTELAGQGITEYCALPLSAGGSFHNAATVATDRAGGFTHEQFTAIDRILKLFALHVERHIALHIAGNVLDTYLGSVAGAKVLKGAIKRGAGQAIRSVIWVSDLRDFTDLSERLPPADVLAVLNAYFERMAGAVLAHGGEVLKFIGDGMLAVFPVAEMGDQAAAQAALSAAEAALAGIDRLNTEPTPALAAIADWSPLKSGIALHGGEVFFGNMGAPDRLDFTVIGRAVNTAARVEALCKPLGRSILITEPVARLIDRPLEPLGTHTLRGVAEPVALYGPPLR